MGVDGILLGMKAPVSLSPEELLALLACARKRRIRDWTAILILVLVRPTAFGVGRYSRAGHSGWLSDDSEAQRVRKDEQLLQWHSEPLLDAKSAMEEWLRVGKSFGKKAARKQAKRTFPQVFIPMIRLFSISGTQFWSLMRKYGREAGFLPGSFTRTL